MDISLISRRLVEMRTERGLGQEYLAEIMGVSLSTYRRFETGQREYTANGLYKLAKFYAVSPNYLLGVSDSKSN